MMIWRSASLLLVLMGLLLLGNWSYKKRHYRAKALGKLVDTAEQVLFNRPLDWTVNSHVCLDALAYHYMVHGKSYTYHCDLYGQKDLPEQLTIYYPAAHPEKGTTACAKKISLGLGLLLTAAGLIIFSIGQFW